MSKSTLSSTAVMHNLYMVHDSYTTAMHSGEFCSFFYLLVCLHCKLRYKCSTGKHTQASFKLAKTGNTRIEDRAAHTSAWVSNPSMYSGFLMGLYKAS